ncbi:class I SAM-dependent methyltransferase [Pricia sp. S334]|uniref:Class I SAM-dependent methyltransferase n=1 Tax=Pricia mediterranea TaxID=3076079 RepID=A0ABU3L8G1_9FLAO|nr:class I SAM-dependent methyltransferase [Pricia sp. S334]MDT7830014.1 class I SAM-dependent methyltransferase [Pricia sp. S334]
MDNFSKQSALYARYRPHYPKELLSEIYGHVKERKRAWDCGTGNGQLAEKLALEFENVHATDISEEQLKYAVPESNINYIKSSAEEPIFESGMFDLITVAQAIHWFDFENFYKEVVRTSKKDGVFAVIGYGRLTTDSNATKTISDFYDKMFRSHFTENREYLDKGYKTIPFPFLEIGYYEFAATYNWNIKDLSGYMQSWSAVQKFREINGFDPTDGIITELSKDWKSSQTVRFPVFLRLARINPGADT